MTLKELNNLDISQRWIELSKCCGATAWIEKMAGIFPVYDSNELFDKAEEIWFSCNEKDWREAFSHHPKIGDINSLKEKFADTAGWAANEQSGALETSQTEIEALARLNIQYEEKFGYIFIVCASGKSAEEMLHMLESRLKNKPEDEIMIAMREQNKITKIRLQKLLS
jgi:2-oxo-4-hydroxy-4-carboxy-5-ureidoimidazoline decarboxylase